MAAINHSSVLPELKTSLETFPSAPQEVCSVLKERKHRYFVRVSDCLHYLHIIAGSNLKS